MFGKEKPSAVSEHTVDDGVWTYLRSNRPAADAIQSHMAKHFCEVSFKGQNVSLQPLPLLLQEKDPNVLKQWRESVKSEFARQLSNLKSVKLELGSESWDETEKRIRQKLQMENVVLVPDQAAGRLVVAGRAHEVDKISRMIEREKSCVTEEVPVSQAVYHVMCLDGFKENVLSTYPDLTLTLQADSPNLIVTGLVEEISELKKALCDQSLDCKWHTLEADRFVIDLLKTHREEELTDAWLKANGFKSAFKVTDDGVRLVARNDRELEAAVDHLNRLLMSEYVDVADKTVLDMPEWKQLVSHLQDADVLPCKRIRVNTSEQQVVVSGHKDDVARVSGKLRQFLTENARIEQTVQVRSSAVISYIQKSAVPWLHSVNDKVAVWCQKDAICLSGRYNRVSECKTLVEEQVAALALERFQVPTPGAMKIYRSQEAVHSSLILKDTGCVVHPVEETSADLGGGPDKALSKPLYQTQTSDGVEIVVCKADLCRYAVHAVICSTTEDLRNTSGLAKALVSAAGPQLQRECDQWTTSKGRLNTGACVVLSTGGKLGCKKVIFTVVPKLDPANTETWSRLKVAVTHSLQLAESQGFTSVALPVIGRNQEVSTQLCAAIIAKAVRGHCGGMLDHGVVKRIHLVDTDNVAVKSMAAAIRREFGTTAPSQVTAVKGPDPAPANQPVDDQKCLGREQTKEGLNIVLVKDRVENAKVIV